MIGIHVNSDIDLICDEIVKAYKYNANIIQLFTQPLDNLKIYYKMKEYLNKYKIEIVIHSSYALNIARPLDIYSWQIRYILQQINIIMPIIGSKYIIIHTGKYLNQPVDIAINNMLDNIIYIANNNKKNIQILLETSAGVGTSLLYKIEDLAKFYNKLNNKYINLCLDTAHIWDSGYDISTMEKFYKFIYKFDKLIGLDKIKIVHLNDSLNPLGSKKDRHQSIGKGYIGNILYDIGKFFINKNIHVILETPFKYHKKELQNLY